MSPKHMEWRFCPLCSSLLEERLIEDDLLLTCTSKNCDFIHYNNPIPVVAAFIIDNSEIILVQRGVEPFIGKWCLPRGYLKSFERPKTGVKREIQQETGLEIGLKRILNACNPSPPNFRLNQMTIFFLATIKGGCLQAGSDALQVGRFKPDALPDICFGSDTKLIADWFAGLHGTIDQPVNFLSI